MASLIGVTNPRPCKFTDKSSVTNSPNVIRDHPVAEAHTQCVTCNKAAVRELGAACTVTNCYFHSLSPHPRYLHDDSQTCKYVPRTSPPTQTPSSLLPQLQPIRQHREMDADLLFSARNCISHHSKYGRCVMLINFVVNRGHAVG